MRKIIALFLVFSFISLSVNLMANESRGADLIIQKTDGQEGRGELIAIKESSLLLKERDSGADVTAVVNEIKTITIINKSQALEWGGIGLLIGRSCGAVLAFIVSGVSMFYEEIDTKKYALVGGTIGGGLGVLIGVITGASAGTDKTIQIEGESDSEIKEVLEDLRKKARVLEFQ